MDAPIHALLLVKGHVRMGVQSNVLETATEIVGLYVEMNVPEIAPINVHLFVENLVHIAAPPTVHHQAQITLLEEIQEKTLLDAIIAV